MDINNQTTINYYLVSVFPMLILYQSIFREKYITIPSMTNIPILPINNA